METDTSFNFPDCNGYSGQGDSVILIADEAIFCWSGQD